MIPRKRSCDASLPTSSRNYTEGMIYYDPSFGYIVITAEQFGGHVLYGRGPSRPFDPDSVEEQRYTTNDKMCWREAVDVPDDWLDALGIPYAADDGDEDSFSEPTTICNITVSPPRLKTWHFVFAVIVWLLFQILWISNK